MAVPAPSRWQQISPFLDLALTLSEEDRVMWLADLDRKDPVLADEIRGLVDKQRELIRIEFLERNAVPIVTERLRGGLTVGAYTLLSPIGQGGMSSVWLGERSDGRYHRRVALKFLRIALDGRGEDRFKREGTILGRLVHPHIAQLIDAGVAPAGPYLVLEHVQGWHIDEYCDRAKLDVEGRVRLFLDVISAVAHAHANFVVHRDIKPSNVLVNDHGEVKLLDFGIGKLLADQPDATLTSEGGGPLTPQYAAPEQLEGGAVTVATDVYALGVLLYQLLSGQHPAGPGPHSYSELVKAIVDQDPAPLSKALVEAADRSAEIAARRGGTTDRLCRTLHGDLEAIVAKALKKNPRERYASVTAFGDDLLRYLRHQPVTAHPDTISYRAIKFARRNSVTVGLASLALAAVLVGAAATMIQARIARKQRDFAFQELARAEQINQLDHFLLTDVAPSGKPIDVNDLLDRAEHIVQRENFQDHPASHVKLLISIGTHYIGREDNDRALRVLQPAYQFSRGLRDSSARAQAACTLAVPVARAGQQARAESLVSEGLRELPQDSEFALDRVYCLIHGSEVAQNDGDARKGVERARAARAALLQSPFRPDSLKLYVLTTLAGAYTLAGQSRDALAAFEETSHELASLGLDDTRTAVSLFNDWGLALMLAARPAEAENVYRRGVELSSGSQLQSDVRPGLLTNYADCLLALGRLNEARTYAEEASAKARQSDSQVIYGQSLMERAKIYRAQADFPRAAAILDELEPLLRRSLQPGHYAFASIASERSKIASATGNVKAALQFANEAVTLDEAAVKNGGQGAHLLWVLYLHRAGIEISAGKPELAGSDAAHALNLATDMSAGKISIGVANAYWTLARALEAQDKHDQARAAAGSAAELFQRIYGPEHPETIAARQLASRTR